jgi:hypothetical protein
VSTAYLENVDETHNAAPEMLQQKIERRAFELFEARGAEDGYALNDWLRAEEEMLPR